MRVSYTVVPAGDLAFQLHFRVVADADFDPTAAIDHITDYPTTQPVLIIVHDDGALDELLITFATSAKKQFNCMLTLVTPERVATPWYYFDRIVIRSSVGAYDGTPANEVHLYFNPDEDHDLFPVVAPIGASQTHIYAWTDKERVSDLISWARRAPYQVGILQRSL